MRHGKSTYGVSLVASFKASTVLWEPLAHGEPLYYVLVTETEPTSAQGVADELLPVSLVLYPVAPVAYQVIPEPGIGQFREYEPRRVNTRVNSLGLFPVHKSTCGKRKRRAVGLLSPMRDKN